MRENVDQNNSEYGHFLRSARDPSMKQQQFFQFYIKMMMRLHIPEKITKYSFRANENFI